MTRASCPDACQCARCVAYADGYFAGQAEERRAWEAAVEEAKKKGRGKR